MRMYPRSEFPVEKFPAIIRKNGSVNRASLAMRLSSAGCPNAKAEVAAAAIKAGHTPETALKIAMLAFYMDDLSMDCIERTCGAITRSAERNHAKKFPNGKCAEDLAARLEGRPSRWGTADFHRNPAPTPHYPSRV